MYELDWMSVETERRILFWMSCGMIVFALLVFVVLLVIPAPYGRYGSSSWGCLMDCRYAWFLQELPSLALPCALWLCHTTTLKLTNKLLLGVFIFHYVHRYLDQVLLWSTENYTLTDHCVFIVLLCHTITKLRSVRPSVCLSHASSSTSVHFIGA